MPANFHEAARRTYGDAEHLDAAGRVGGADHLFGIAAECALKAILAAPNVAVITSDPPKKPFKCHIDKLWQEFQAAASGLPCAIPALGTNPFASWLAEHRYEADSFFTAARLEAHKNGAFEAMKMFEAAALAGVTP